MGLSHFLIELAEKAAKRRNRIYGLEPPRAVKKLFEEEKHHIKLSESLKLISYTISGSPRAILSLFWHRLTDRDTPKRRQEIERLTSELKKILSENCRIATDYFERRLYSRDVAKVPAILEKTMYRTTPLVMVQPTDESDISTLLRFAQQRRIFVYPRGASSSAFGGVVPTRNGIVLDISAMNKILEIDSDSFLARVQAGVRWADLATNLERYGLTPMTIPSSRFSTTAGWVATGGLGIESFRYGHVSQAVVSARVVLPNGNAVELNSQDKNFKYLIGTEGQFGIITELTLRTRARSTYFSPKLFYFKNAKDAFNFVNQLIDEGHKPSHIAFFDRERMAEENILFCDRSGTSKNIVEASDAILLHFDDVEAEQKFLNAIKQRNSFRPSDAAAAHYLWSERYFPFKAQRLGTNLLAGEVVLKREAVPKFIRRARRLAWFFGIRLAVEATFSSDSECITIASFRSDSTKRIAYFLHLALVQLLVHLGTRLSGHPYGIGIWNSPFLRKNFPPRQ